MPDVESVVVRIDRREQPPVPGARARIFAVVEAGFAQRRKTLRRALANAGYDENGVAAITALQLDPQCRPENVSPSQLLALFARLRTAT